MSREMMLREVAITKILGARSWPSFLQCRLAKKKKKERERKKKRNENRSPVVFVVRGAASKDWRGGDEVGGGKKKKEKELQLTNYPFFINPSLSLSFFFSFFFSFTYLFIYLRGQRMTSSRGIITFSAKYFQNKAHF